MDDTKSMEIFSKAPVSTAVLKNALPAMAAAVMLLIYNLADTFFIGLTHNDISIAAVSLAMPIFMIFVTVGSIFGVGGTSVISRAMGEGKVDYAKKVCSFCMWSCVAVGIVLTVLVFFFMDEILAMVGASPETMEASKMYLSIVSCGGIFAIISGCFSNVIRAEGRAGEAMMGQMVGNLLNIILDPIMILVFDWGIAGAAIATVIGILFGAAFYIIYFLHGKSILSIHPKDFSMKDGICKGVLAIGIPASLGSLMMSVSQMVVNSQMAQYGDMALAGISVAMKVTMIIAMLGMGLGQGIQPLLGYCVGARAWERFKKVFRFSSIFALVLSLVLTLLCYMFTGSMVKMMLTNEAAYNYGVQFAHILLITSFLFGVFNVLCNALQAMGAATAALIVNLSRQGIIYIPALFILQYFLGITGLVWAQPVADVLSTILVAALYFYTVRKMEFETSRNNIQINEIV